MIVAGINFSNDAAAAVVANGEVVAACREERFSRRKHDASFPHRALAACLDVAGTALHEVDEVAFFWNAGRHIRPNLGRWNRVPRHHAEYLHAVPNHLLQALGQPEVTGLVQELRLATGRTLRVRYIDHHLCHAASAFFASPFDECAILTVDGYGEQTSTHLWVGRGRRIEPVLHIEFPHSLGSLYAAVTQYLGFRPNNGEGKVMGLASYGEPRLTAQMRELVELTDDGFRLDLDFFRFYVERTTRWAPRFAERFGPPRAPHDPIEPRHQDVARALQDVTEEVLVHLARIARARTGQRNLAMAGGVVLNCVANTRVAREAGFEACFFQPAADDGGTSLGAALWSAIGIHGMQRSNSRWSDYLGMEFDAEAIEAALRKANIPWRRCDDAPGEAASRIARGEIIGWFQGRAEFGPRALGNRSILADPRDPRMKDTLNARVKFRESFRPFAPSVLEHRCGEWFDDSTPSPFMLRVYQTLPARRDQVPAITHVDGGARVQTVAREDNPRYYALIERFEQLTGVPMVLNTSFNVRGEPIVNSPDDALRCFFATDMDAVFLGDFLVERPRSA